MLSLFQTFLSTILTLIIHMLKFVINVYPYKYLIFHDIELRNQDSTLI